MSDLGPIGRRRLCASGLGLALWPLAARAAAEAPAPELATYERQTGGRVGVYAYDLTSGRKLAWRADERFVMCSSFKASLVACVLNRVDRNQERLDRIIAYGPGDLLGYAPVARDNLAKGGLPVEEMCRAAVELSDNTCANKLLASIGGPSAMTAFWRSVGDKLTRLDHNEPKLNRSKPGDPRDTTTPAAMAGDLRGFVLGDVLAAASRERLTGWLVNCRTGADRLRAGLPPSWRIGDKTGNNGADAAGDIAVAWPAPDRPILIATYVQGGSPTPDQIKAVFAAVGRMVGRELG
ncbi:MAG TPA: class A beta-lactamase [Caulobacteraceae bacterium]